MIVELALVLHHVVEGAALEHRALALRVQWQLAKCGQLLHASAEILLQILEVQPQHVRVVAMRIPAAVPRMHRLSTYSTCRPTSS